MQTIMDEQDYIKVISNNFNLASVTMGMRDDIWSADIMTQDMRRFKGRHAHSFEMALNVAVDKMIDELCLTGPIVTAFRADMAVDLLRIKEK